jgi:hypothetical protein
MEPKLPGSGTVAADQTAAAKPPTTNNAATNTTSQAGRATGQDAVSMSPPSRRGQTQTEIDQSDGR